MSKFNPTPLDGKWATRCPKLKNVGFHFWKIHLLEDLDYLTNSLYMYSYGRLCEALWEAIQKIEVNYITKNHSDMVVFQDGVFQLRASLQEPWLLLYEYHSKDDVLDLAKVLYTFDRSKCALIEEKDEHNQVNNIYLLGRGLGRPLPKLFNTLDLSQIELGNYYSLDSVDDQLMLNKVEW